MEQERSHREEDEGRGRRRPEGFDEERRRRRSWIGDAEIARSLNAALQDEDFAGEDD